MSNPFHTIKDAVTLSVDEKNRIKSTLVDEIRKTSVIQKKVSAQKSSYVLKVSGYLFSGVAVCAAIVLVFSNGNKPIMVRDTQLITESAQSSVSDIGAAPALFSVTASRKVTTSDEPIIVIRLKPKNQFLVNYIPICYNGGEVTCYPSKSDLHSKPVDLGDNYYVITAAGNAFSLVTYQEGFSVSTDDELANLFSKGIKLTFADASVVMYQCTHVMQKFRDAYNSSSNVEVLKNMIKDNVINECDEITI